MIAEKVITASDIKECIDLYVSQADLTFIAVEKQRCLASFYDHLQAGAFIRCVKEDGKIRAWILGRKSVSELTGRRNLIQLYYASDLSGIQAAKAVICLHRYLMEVAEKQKIYQVISQGSFMDEKNTFSRILGKIGWIVRGYCAIWYSSHDPYLMNQ